MHFFRDETPLGRFFNAAGDIIITNLLFILLCVPLVTIGAAISGLEYFHLKRRRGSDESAPKLLMQGFRMNFKQSTIGWLILCLLFYLVTVNLNAFGQDGPMENQALYIISMAAAAFILFFACYFFSVVCAFKGSLRTLAADSVMLAGKHPLSTLAMAAMPALCAWFTMHSADLLLALIPVWIACGFSLIAWADSYILIRIFRPFLDEKPEADSPS
ncbi:MAG: YesL family protein [Lachnospiraceae bacterium]|jgi:uncharacterized membrane protein YesL|nr:YesL family protein [Lachnospiraceae bacterium]MCH4071073.1 YesL family protein [Lachnospiraceae bacterium]MCH4108144.1 YesL family protein [Lachnospiraceae bacterium]MCI1302846.1 YesL family protein [Lachnospiraceae bacterium]MCI1332095.1 YesL family protein [Lachnospiraceae bacterium]